MAHETLYLPPIVLSLKGSMQIALTLSDQRMNTFPFARHLCLDWWAKATAGIKRYGMVPCIPFDQPPDRRRWKTLGDHGI